MAYDQADHELVLFGGGCASGWCGDTWSYANQTWTEVCSGNGTAPVCPNNPGANVGDPMVYDPAAQALLLVNSGGYTWTFANGSWTEQSRNFTLDDASGAAMAFDPSIDKVLLLLAIGGGDCQTYTYSNGTWTELATVDHIPGVIGGALFYDPLSSRMIYFGGESATGLTPYGSEWAFSGGEWTLQSPSTLPPAGAPAGFSFDPTYGYGLLFTNEAVGNYTWAYSNGNWTNQSTYLPSSPTPRVGSAMAFDPELGASLALFGQYSSNDSLIPDAWVLYAPLSLTIGLSPAEIDLGQMLAVDPVIRGGVAPYRLNYSALPPNCTPPVMPGNFTCQPSQAGSTPVRAELSAYLGGDAIFEVLAQVNPDPTIQVGAFPNPTTVGVSVLFTSEVMGGTYPVSVNWTLGDGNSSVNPSVTHAYEHAATYVVQLVGKDARGLSAYANVSLRVNSLPSVFAAAAPNVTDVGLPVRFSSTDSGGTGLRLPTWQFGDGNISTLPNVTHVYSEPGDYSASVSIVDGLQVNSSTARLAVRVNPDPVLVAVSNVSTAAPGATIQFSALVSGGTAPYSYLWDFGAGVFAQGASPPYSYPSPGNETVRVTLTDAAGFNTTASVELTIRSPGNSTHSPPPTGESPSISGLPDWAFATLVLVGVIAAAGWVIAIWRRGGAGGSRDAPATESARHPGVASIEPSDNDSDAN